MRAAAARAGRLLRRWRSHVRPSSASVVPQPAAPDHLARLLPSPGAIAMFRRRRPLLSLQVEVTTRCSLSCAFCPRRHLAGWVDADLSEAAWARIERDLRLASDVHLQGWGEPLLDPRLPMRARAAHRAGCSVGLTTNGAALADAVRWIVAERIERVAISVGAGPARHANDRGGLALDGVWSAVEALVSARRRRAPRVLVSVMATRDGGDFAAVVRSAARAGADEVYVTHVDCTPSPALLARTAFTDGTIAPHVRAALDAAAAAASSLGIRFRAPALEAQELLVCALDPRRFAFVAADGRIGPCVNMLLPVTCGLLRHGEHGVDAVEPMIWGRLPEDTLADALGRRAAFLAAFDARLEAERRFREEAVDGWGTPALRALDRAEARRSRALADHPFPPGCAGCHKMRGW
jgi:MoaA/NifB/PqqE/SkfB family radical SAM enzyme